MKTTITCFLMLLLSANIGAQVTITDASLVGGQTYNWTNNNTYIVDGLVFLESGGTLNIQEGTVVKFTEQPAGSASALVIARGAKIYAIGTPDAPIIMTAEIDDVNDPTDLGPSDVQLWGGLIMLGSATNVKSGSYENSVEGIDSGEPRGLYGATGNDPANFNDDDNSGEIRYVSIRHTGFGLTSGSELQGLTLAGVGRGTKISFIDIYASSDDGVETFGGTVDLKYMCVSFAEDDSYDFDEQWTGKAQFLFSIQRSDVADSGWEYDGSTPDDTPEFSNGAIFNFTHIGSGIGAAASNPIGLNIRAGGAVTAANGIVTEMKGKAIEIQDKADNTTTDSYARFLGGLTHIDNNIFYNIGSYTLLDGSDNGVIRVTSGADDATAGAFATAFASTNTYGNPSLVSISRDQDGGLDPRPSMTGPAYTTPLASYPSDPFFTTANYKGAISATANQCFIAKWTTLAKNGHLASGLDWNGLETSINEYNGVINDLKVFPNPANGIVNIYYNADNAVSVEIFNLQGQVVRSINGLSAGIRTEAIPVSDLSKGLYFVKFTDGVNTFSQKLLVD